MSKGCGRNFSESMVDFAVPVCCKKVLVLVWVDKEAERKKTGAHRNKNGSRGEDE